MSDPKIVLTAEDKTKATFDQVKASLTGLKTHAAAVTGALAGLGITAYVATMARDIAHVAEQWDELGKAAQRAGFQSAQGMAEFQFAAKLAGVDAGGFETAVGKLSTKMAEAAGGNKDAAATFAALGIKIKTNTGELRANEDVLGDLAAKFASYRDGPEKAALATDLFGKSGRELIPLLNGGREGLDRLREEFRKLRGEISDESIKASEQYNDNLTKLQAATGGLARNLASQLLPALVQVTEKMVDAAKEGGILRGILAGIIEAAQVATNTDALGSAKGQAQIANQRISHITTQMDVQQAILERDPQNSAAASRLNQLKSRLTEVQAEALRATDALKTLLDPKYDERFGTTGNFARADRANYKPAAPIAAKGDGKAATTSEYDALIKRIKERLDGQTAELSAGRELTDQEKFHAKVVTDLSLAKKDLTDQQRKAIEATLAETDAKGRQLERLKAQRTEDKAWAEQVAKDQADEAAAFVASYDARQKYAVAIQDEIRALTEAGEVLDLEGRLIGSTDRDRAVSLENLRIEIKLRKELREISENPNFTPEEREQKRQELRDKADLEKRNATRRADIDQSREFSDQLHGDVKGALTRAFEDSKNPGKAFAEALASTLYTRVSSALADSLLGAMGLGNGASGNYLNGMLGKLFGGGSSAPAGFLNDAGGLEVLGSLGFHRGGVVGSDAPTFTRAVNPALFANAPRYHRGGIASNEVAAVLEVGEEVLTTKDPRHRRNGGGGTQITFAPVISIDSRSDRGAVSADVNRALAANNKALIEQLRRNGVMA